MLESIPDIWALIGGDGDIQYVSPHVEGTLGYCKHDLEGRPVFDFIHPEDVPRAAREFADTVENANERVPSVLRLRDAAGNWIPFEIIANNQLQDPDLQAVVFTARDLRFRKEIEDSIRRANADIEKHIEERTTELAKTNAALRIENQARRHAENLLHHTVSLLHATLDSTTDGVLVVSNERKVSSCNRKFIEMWGLGCDALIGVEDEPLLAQVAEKIQDPQEFVEKVLQLYADRSAESFDTLNLKDGRIFERSSQPQRLGDTIVGRVWSFRDITQARQMEIELRHSQKMEALGRLAGGIAHDFNNLLMLISGYATQLSEDPSLAAGHAACEQILATTKRAATVTRQLLAFSRKHPNAPNVTDLNTIVLDMERLLQRLLPEHVELQISIAKDTQPIYADRSQIELLVMNLAINARDAMPNGGLLTITTASELLPAKQPASDDVKSTFALLKVSDTGHGMTKEIQAHIFEPFFTTKEVGKGTGLGLSTAFGMVKKAGGHIEVDSEPDRGATFRVYLPRVSAVPIATTALPLVKPPVGGLETILLAEDEAGIRAMTRAYLEGLGYRVLEAANGTEAIRLSLEYVGRIDLVLSDILMPGSRGDAAVAAIRNYRPDVKVIYVSGYTDPITGCESDSVLYKPFEFPELGRRVRAVLDGESETSPDAEANSAAD